MMIVRAPELVCPAQKLIAVGLSFTDRAAISQVLLGYIYEAADTGIIKGLSNESLNGEIPISRAETVNMIFRALSYVEKGYL